MRYQTINYIQPACESVINWNECARGATVILYSRTQGTSRAFCTAHALRALDSGQWVLEQAEMEAKQSCEK